jgi:hypothetical protein
MGRSIYCSTCKKEKEVGRDNESRCKSCKSEANKKRRAKKREDKGLQPFGTGRNIYCYECKKIKEVRSRGYCNACAAKRDNEWRLRTGRTSKHQDGLCPTCGKQKKHPNGSYCITCSNMHSAKWKRENPRTGEELRKFKVRQFTRYCIRKGYIELLPCSVCGTNEKVEAHHDDYDKPLEVRFLCRKHHREHHKSFT